MMNSLYPSLVTDILGVEETANVCEQRQDTEWSRGTDLSVMASGLA